MLRFLRLGRAVSEEGQTNSTEAVSQSAVNKNQQRCGQAGFAGTRGLLMGPEIACPAKGGGYWEVIKRRGNRESSFGKL